MQLVCPAGNLPALQAAVDAGANAVYAGFRDQTNARAFPGLNFSDDELRAGIRYAHSRNAKVYLALNTYPDSARLRDWHAAVDKAAGDAARSRIEQITMDVEAGQVYEGKVVRIMDFGAFVAILPGRDGMVHVSQICEERVQNVSDKLAVGDIVKVRVMEIDKQGRIRLTMKGLN